jgi:hypothetical protein
MEKLSLEAQSVLIAYENANMSASLDGVSREGMAAAIRKIADEFAMVFEGGICAAVPVDDLLFLADELDSK